MFKLTVLKCEGANEEKDYIVDASISSDSQIIRYLYDELKADKDIDVSKISFENNSLIVTDITFTDVCLVLVTIASAVDDEVELDASSVFFQEDLERIAAFYYKFKGGKAYAF